jgi:hypothetical protein
MKSMNAWVDQKVTYLELLVSCRELDENMTQQIADVKFDTDVSILPQAPDVSNYMSTEVGFWRMWC